MKKLLAMLLMLLLPWTALADAPPAFSDALFNASPAEFALACEEALADTSLAGSTVAEKDGALIVAWDEYFAFAVMRRPDGLLMLCHFTPMGDKLLLAWHNDLLLSYYQELSLTMQGATWSGGNMPELYVYINGMFGIDLFPNGGAKLSLLADWYRDGWRVEEMSLFVMSESGRWHNVLRLPEDCLANDIYLATCKPFDWRRGEQEEEVTYGW